MTHDPGGPRASIQARQAVGRYRYLVIWIMWLALCVAAFDRSNVSLLLVDPGFLRDMGVEGSPERQGLIMTALLAPYALSNILLSPAADKWGPRRVIAAMAVSWAAISVWLGLAGSYTMLLVGRAARGIGEGPMFPIANRFVRNWFPAFERGGANAIWTTGQRVGLAIATPILAATIAAFGWRASFFLQTALVLMLLLPAIWFISGDSPETTARVKAPEREHIRSGQADAVRTAGSWASDLTGLLKSSSYWLAIVYHFSTLAVYFGLVTWLPKYLSQERGFEVTWMVVLTFLPHILSMISGLVFGFLSDRYNRRAVFCAVGLAGTSASIVISAVAPDPFVSAVMMSVGFTVWGIGSPIYYAIMQRIVPSHLMATGIGIDNGLSNVGSALAPFMVGVLIGTTGSFMAGLLFLAAVGLLGAAAAGVLVIQRY